MRELGVGELGVREFDRIGWIVRVVSWSSRMEMI